MRTCMNCRNAYVEDGKVRCRVETEMPFFDMDEIIANPEEECCGQWKGYEENEQA